MSNSELQDIFDNYEPEFQDKDWADLKQKLEKANRSFLYHFRYDLLSVLCLFLLIGGVYINLYQARKQILSLIHPVAITHLGLQAGQLLLGWTGHAPPPDFNATPSPNPLLHRGNKFYQNKAAQHQEETFEQYHADYEFFNIEKSNIKIEKFNLSLPDAVAQIPNSPKTSPTHKANPKTESYSLSGGMMLLKSNRNTPVREGLDVRLSARLYRKLHVVAAFQQYTQDGVGRISATRTLDQTPIPVLFEDNLRFIPKTAYTNIPYSYHSMLNISNLSLGLSQELFEKKKLRFKATALLQNNYVNKEHYDFYLIADDRLTIPNYDPKQTMGSFHEYYGRDTKIHFVNSMYLSLSINTPIYKGLQVGLEPFLMLPLKSIGVQQNHIQSFGLTLRLGYSKIL